MASSIGIFPFFPGLDFVDVKMMVRWDNRGSPFQLEYSVGTWNTMSPLLPSVPFTAGLGRGLGVERGRRQVSFPCRIWTLEKGLYGCYCWNHRYVLFLTNWIHVDMYDRQYLVSGINKLTGISCSLPAAVVPILNPMSSLKEQGAKAR